MKKITIILIIISIVGVILLTGCGQQKLSTGTYVNENNSNESIVVYKDTIKFNNLNFDDLNEELKKDMGFDFKLTETLSKNNSYSIDKSNIIVDVANIVSLNFEFKDKVIYVNNKKFVLQKEEK